MVDLGRQILRESPRTDENGKGNSAKAVNIASSTGLRSTSGASGEVASFGRKTERCEHPSIFGHRRLCHSVLPNLPNLPKRAYKIIVDGIGSYSFHLEIEDDWPLVHQATDPQRLSLTSFFPKRGQGKGPEQFIGF
jgi:hypothetical protein